MLLKSDFLFLEITLFFCLQINSIQFFPLKNHKNQRTLKYELKQTLFFIKINDYENRIN